MGKPIEVPKMTCPSNEMIDEIHEKFTSALVMLFEENKHKYEEDPSSSKLIIDWYSSYFMLMYDECFSWNDVVKCYFNDVFSTNFSNLHFFCKDLEN